MKDILAAMNLLSRKSSTSKSALMFVLTLASSVGLCVYGKLTGQEWSSLMTFVLPAFLAAETGRRWSPKTEKEPAP